MKLKVIFNSELEDQIVLMLKINEAGLFSIPEKIPDREEDRPEGKSVIYVDDIGEDALRGILFDINKANKNIDEDTPSIELS